MGNTSTKSNNRLNRKSVGSEKMLMNKKGDNIGNRDFVKATSMYEMSTSQNKDIVSNPSKNNKSLIQRVGSAKKAKDSGGESSKKGLNKKNPHPVSGSGKKIIIFCFETPHQNLGDRTFLRIFEKRMDFQLFIHNFGRNNLKNLSENLKALMENVVANLDDVSAIEKFSEAYGESHIEYKPYGFKPDFFVGYAEALTVELIILDQANHSPTDVVAAFGQLISKMFTCIRDGYYKALRLQRIASRKTLLQKKDSFNEEIVVNEEEKDKLPLSDTPTTTSSKAKFFIRTDSVNSESKFDSRISDSLVSNNGDIMSPSKTTPPDMSNLINHPKNNAVAIKH
uniref:GLOBIN domain-containing protein n=1 Tax=Rhabditophanes sp. KR3021 TaxID=114890 RepID=A0AC35UFS5_9BILA